jgi:TolB-like protein/DNA-binding winged helix-turn-helix (wHTH) protein/Tfp pilus assembly protein PilF
MEKEIYEFGPFSLDPAERIISRDGTSLSLTPKVFDTLVCLVRKPGRLLTKGELLNQIWPATFVEEVNLAVNISTLRKVLGESPQDVRYIATVPGRGYRFVAEVKVIHSHGEGKNNPAPAGRLDVQLVSESTGSSAVVRGTRNPFPFASPVWLRRLIAPLGYLLAALLLAFMTFTTKGGAWRELRLGTPDPQIRSIVVLPLESLSHDHEQEYFADGMTEALISDLSQISALRVISRTSAMHYKGTKKTLPEIAKELNVDGVVEGSVVRSGNQVRITAQLLQARSDQHVWGEIYNRELGDVLKLQSDVAQAIAGQVRAQLTPQQQARLNSAAMVNAAAFEIYLKGRHFAFKKFTVPDITKAQSSYREAIRLDPRFTLAYVGLADTYRTLGDFRALSPQEANNNAKKAIQKALELDPRLGEAHTTLGTLSWRYDWDWATAEKEFRRSLELNPNYAHGHIYLAIFLGWKGNRSEALAEMAKARELDPFCPGDEMIYYHLRDYQPMMEAGLRDVTSNPDNWLGHYFLAVAYEGSGKVEAGIPEYQKAVELSGGDADATAALAHAYAVSGQKTRAENILRDVLRQSGDSYVSPYLIATMYGGLGDKNRAFEFLQKAYDERSSDLPYFLNADLRIDSLRSDPRFAGLLKKMQLSR